MSRIEAETRNVQTLVKAGSLEHAASGASALFETCQEAGLLVSTVNVIVRVHIEFAGIFRNCE